MHEPFAVYMRPLVTPEWMAEADRMTIEAGTTAETLMDRAGRAVARVVLELAGGRYGRKVAIVCGPGNNGGDGFVAARVLRREGLAAHCFLVGDRASVRGAADHHLALLERHGGAIETGDIESLDGYDVVVDALFGTGFHGTAEGAAARAIEAMNESSAPVVAVDIPSGVNGTTGAVEGPAVRAAVTVTFHGRKLGTALAPGASYAGDVVVVDIGIRPHAAQALMTMAEEIARLVPPRPPEAHKRSAGAVALLAGSNAMSGAAILAARGAMRVGAGYVTVGVTSGIRDVVASALPEALTAIVSTDDVLGPQALEEFKPVLERATALAVGPGLGTGDRQKALVHAVLEQVALPVVLDADALNVLAGDTQALRARTGPTVITPHPGELARLLETDATSIQNDRAAAVKRAANELRCTVVLKGYRSVISEGAGTLVVNPTGGPSLATAGTGDVLTGVIAALLAAGLRPTQAAIAGTYLHGLAGDLVTEGALASDVADALPEALEMVRS